LKFATDVGRVGGQVAQQLDHVGLGGSVHTLRHTFISHLVMNGADLGVVQKLAGHSSIATTMRYSHLAAGHAKAAVKKISL
jgi:site-specific recombinase XerD